MKILTNLGCYLVGLVLMNKQKLLKLVIKEVELRYEALAKSALVAKDAATNEESKAENKYDTRGLEASYLAGAQAGRTEKLKESLFYLNKITADELSAKKESINLLSLVKLTDEEGVDKNLFIIPVQGGIKINFDNILVQTITLSSPIGMAIINKSLGDEIVLKQGGSVKYFDVVAVS